MTVGIDEVGRGPLAGPVAVCAFAFSHPKHRRAARTFAVPLRDSKQLTREQRELWYAELCRWQKAGKCSFKVTMISAQTIDQIGIAPAIRRALKKSLTHVAASTDVRILLDGGLKAPEEYPTQKTIIKGDEKEMVIALASIAAKVTRDRHMFRQHTKFPEYGFESHVGYGTKVHRNCIRTYGPCAIHRKSFIKKVY